MNKKMMLMTRKTTKKKTNVDITEYSQCFQLEAAGYHQLLPARKAGVQFMPVGNFGSSKRQHR